MPGGSEGLRERAGSATRTQSMMFGASSLGNGKFDKRQRLKLQDCDGFQTIVCDGGVSSVFVLWGIHVPPNLGPIV